MTEKLMGLDMMRFALKDEPWMGTVSARREALPFHAGDLVLLRVPRIVSHPVNARNRNCIARFEDSANLRHDRILSVLGALIGKVSISDVAHDDLPVYFLRLRNSASDSAPVLSSNVPSVASLRMPAAKSSPYSSRESRSGCLIVFS